jgi:hypothetical protein
MKASTEHLSTLLPHSTPLPSYPLQSPSAKAPLKTPPLRISLVTNKPQYQNPPTDLPTHPLPRIPFQHRQHHHHRKPFFPLLSNTTSRKDNRKPSSSIHISLETYLSTTNSPSLPPRPLSISQTRHTCPMLVMGYRTPPPPTLSPQEREGGGGGLH